jgi:hypothetical protein
MKKCPCGLCTKKYGPRETVYALHPKRPEPTDPEVSDEDE